MMLLLIMSYRYIYWPKMGDGPIWAQSNIVDWWVWSVVCMLLWPVHMEHPAGLSHICSLGIISSTPCRALTSRSMFIRLVSLAYVHNKNKPSGDCQCVVFCVIITKSSLSWKPEKTKLLLLNLISKPDILCIHWIQLLLLDSPVCNSHCHWVTSMNWWWQLGMSQLMWVKAHNVPFWKLIKSTLNLASDKHKEGTDDMDHSIQLDRFSIFWDPSKEKMSSMWFFSTRST